MNPTLVEQVARAVLYEGYMLYPYRPSVKNRQRWTFGGLQPEAYSRAQGGSEPFSMRTECLVLGGPGTTLTVSVRFLQLVARRVGEFDPPLADWPESGATPTRMVESLRIGDEVVQTWEEAVERTFDLGDSTLGDLTARPRRLDLQLPASLDQEPIRDSGGAIVGMIARERRPIEASVDVSAESVGDGISRISVEIANRTPFDDAESASRDEALMSGLVSTHAILGVRRGEFVSQIDPPEALRDLSAGCRNVGAWPVLVGVEGEKDTILSAPIILYDYPRIAPESPGDLFDSTEIDEILTLRIMTLTEDEKRSMSSVDERARAILERTEALAREQLMGLHGTVRGLRPITGA